MKCPLCSNALAGGELVMVCSPCHQALHGGDGGLSVNATGEFRVVASELIDGEVSGEHPVVHTACAWCHKSEPEVRKLLGRGGVALCDQCVALCCDVLDAELGHWR